MFRLARVQPSMWDLQTGEAITCTRHWKPPNTYPWGTWGIWNFLFLNTCIFIKGAVSRQSSAFCLILPITRPQSLWNLKQAKKLRVNDKIRDPRQTNISWALFLKLQPAGTKFEKLLGSVNSFQKP